tara:strand:- start:693 stop:1145 length:453 start_codon:yes stop_codon:yes gene_type:complete
MKLFKMISVILFAMFVGIQFIPTTRNESNEVLTIDFIKNFNPPEKISNLLRSSCYDCHSNNTIYPWYNKVQPISWFLEGHIREAKVELNFSEFGNYSNRKKKSKLKSITSQVKGDEMPPLSYTLIHRDAKLSEQDKFELEKWLTELRDSF